MFVFDRYPYGQEELAACDDFDAVITCSLYHTCSICCVAVSFQFAVYSPHMLISDVVIAA
jgi:hypothetical protein